MELITTVREGVSNHKLVKFGGRGKVSNCVRFERFADFVCICENYVHHFRQLLYAIPARNTNVYIGKL